MRPGHIETGPERLICKAAWMPASIGRLLVRQVRQVRLNLPNDFIGYRSGVEHAVAQQKISARRASSGNSIVPK